MSACAPRVAEKWTASTSMSAAASYSPADPIAAKAKASSGDAASRPTGASRRIQLATIRASAS